MTNNHFTNVEDLRSALRSDNIQDFTLQVKLVDICFIETSFGQMCWDGHAGIVRAFLEKKITTVNDIVSKIGKFKAVHIAATRGHVDVMRVLVDYGASIDIADIIQVTPLLYAVRHQNYDMVKYLIENDANVNAIDIVNHTPLYEAIMNGNFNIVKYLIEKGVILHNALEIAIKNDRPIIAKYIDSLQPLKTLLRCENDFQESVAL